MQALKGTSCLRTHGNRTFSAIRAVKRVIEPTYYDDIYPSVYDRVVNNGQSLKLEEVGLHATA